MKPIFKHDWAITSLLIAAFVPRSFAFPSGAGGCVGGQPAVGGSHSTAEITTGDLTSGGFVVLFDQTPINAGSNIKFTTGIDHELAIESSGGQFRGFLIRLGSDNKSVTTTNALRIPEAATDIRLAQETCIASGVGGLTHTEPNVKSAVSGILRMDSPATSLPLDVTIVVQNRNGVSEFYYSNFTLRAVGGTYTLQAKASLPSTYVPISPRIAPSVIAPGTTTSPSQGSTTSAAPSLSNAPTSSSGNSSYAPSITPSLSTPGPSRSIATLRPTATVFSIAPTGLLTAPSVMPTSAQSASPVPTTLHAETLAPSVVPTTGHVETLAPSVAPSGVPSGAPSGTPTMPSSLAFTSTTQIPSPAPNKPSTASPERFSSAKPSPPVPLAPIASTKAPVGSSTFPRKVSPTLTPSLTPSSTLSLSPVGEIPSRRPSQNPRNHPTKPIHRNTTHFPHAPTRHNKTQPPHAPTFRKRRRRHQTKGIASSTSATPLAKDAKLEKRGTLHPKKLGKLLNPKGSVF